MHIQKIESTLTETLRTSLQNYIQAWHKIPQDIDLENLTIERIRYVMNWGLKTAPEEGFILEFGSHRELLAKSELGRSIEAYKELINEQNENAMLFGKDVVTNDLWYEYPVIYGELDATFDDIEDYEKGGKYAGNEYQNFRNKYD